MFENIKNALKQKKILHAAVEGVDRVTKIEFIDGALDKVNLIFNSFDLLGYEKRSGTVEFYFGKKYLGRGYVADISGVTVDLTRFPGETEKYIPDFEMPESTGIPGSLAIIARGIATRIKPIWNKKEKPVMIPCVFLIGESKVNVIKFEYLRLIPGYLIDDVNEIRYKIKDTVSAIDILMPDGKAGRGFFLDETGYNIDLKRSVKVFASDKDGNPIKKEGKEVEVSINFSGVIGQQATAEKIGALLSGTTGREKLMMVVMGFLAGQLLFMVLHI